VKAAAYTSNTCTVTNTTITEKNMFVYVVFSHQANIASFEGVCPLTQVPIDFAKKLLGDKPSLFPFR